MLLHQKCTVGESRKRVMGPAALSLYAPGLVSELTGLSILFCKLKGWTKQILLNKSNFCGPCQLYTFECNWWLCSKSFRATVLSEMITREITPKDKNIFPRLPGTPGHSPARMFWVECFLIKAGSVGAPRTCAQLGSRASPQNRTLLFLLPRWGCSRSWGFVTEVRGWQSHFQTHFSLFSSEAATQSSSITWEVVSTFISPTGA